MGSLKTIALKSNDITLTLRKTLFWDVDLQSVEIHKHQRLIIERVFLRGNLFELKQLVKVFDKNIIAETLKKSGSLDKKTLSFICKFYSLKKSDFTCYTRKLSMNQPSG